MHLRRLFNRRSQNDSGLTLLTAIVTLGLFSLLVLVVAKLISGFANQSRHLEYRGAISDTQSFVYNSISCSETLADQTAECTAGDFVELRDHSGEVIAKKYPDLKTYSNNLAIRAKCRTNNNIFFLDPEYSIITSNDFYRDTFSGKVYDWRALSTVSFACPCFASPSFGQVPTVPAAAYPGLIRTSVYFANVATNPSGSGMDPALGSPYNLPAFPMIHPPNTLSKTVFTIPTPMLVDVISNLGVPTIDFLGSSHQFYFGLDMVRISFEAGSFTASVTSTPNPYSSYGYATFSNLRVENGIPMGTVSMHALGYYEGVFQMGLGSLQDYTNLVRPSSLLVAPTNVYNDIDLRNFKVTIDLFANSYDSVQYRAVRVNLWANRPLNNPLAKCP